MLVRRVRELMAPAVKWGSVAASFVIEQDGLPTLTVADGRELWNGQDSWDRLALWQL